ncbi:type I restriction enzyme S subunit [Acinetobacter sp. BIGb0196]|nr:MULTISPECIES: restriction endonuclease subunit S [Acinetobacter]MCS4298918.1 type I restriction enzyme S subunit [Acinetobacter guillouiae]MCW2252344.1 type I restriction enzyme S subunit [Acinetobacter sp. BIGb0204]NII38069.1 type I restriction enzyme S subunit [Acinetobacter sp. BIGb0196]
MSTPKLRFKEFNGGWTKQRVDSFLERVSNPVDVIADQQYTQIGIRSHGKGIFHKESIDGKSLGNKRVFWVEPSAFVVNIVFAWERAIAVTSDAENGMIASHRFPMYLPKNNLSNVNFLRYLFVTDKGQSYLELASPGGAGRNKTLGQSNFAELKIDLPSLEEQTKIASFLSIMNEKISLLTKKHKLLSLYKQGLLQKLFSQQIRFKTDDGSEFVAWEERKLGDICSHFQSGKTITSATISDKGAYPVYGGNGLRGYTDTYTHDGIFTLIGRQGALCGNINLVDGKNFISEHAIAVQAKIDSSTIWLSIWLDYMQLNRFSESSAQAGLAVNKLVKFDINVPCLEEQTKIANFLSAIDQKIEAVVQQIEQTKQWKKGLLQQMFV